MREPTTRGPAVEIDEFEKRLRSGATPAQSSPPARLDILVPPPPASDERPDPLVELARLMPSTKYGSGATPPVSARSRPQTLPVQNPTPDPAPRRIEPTAPPLPRPAPTAKSMPSTPSLPPLPPLPPLPTLPPLPKRDPQSQRQLPPPTFTPPVPTPLAFNLPDMALRGTLPAQDLEYRSAPEDHARSGPAPVNPNPIGSAYAASGRAGVGSVVAGPAPADHPDVDRAGGGQYIPEHAEPGYAPQAQAVDPALQTPQTPHDAEYYGDEYYADSDNGWPEDSRYAPDEYDSHDDDYAREADYGADQNPVSSGIDAIRRKLRPWHAIAAVAALAVVSIGWSFLHRAGVDGSHEIATIEAPEGPMKVKPAIEPESDAPTAGAAAVLDRNEPEPVKKVVKNLEQAVDPSVSPQQNANVDSDVAPPGEIPGTVQLGAGRVNAPHEPPPPGGPQQPRKVKSIAVPVTPVVAPPVVPTQAPAASQPLASTAAKPAPGPTYSAQFSSANREADARAQIKTLSGKYGGKFTFKPVKTGDKTVYRVRVGGLTREAADALCAKAKTGGDSCAVVGN